MKKEKSLPIIYVFCEGEGSEELYTQFLKEKFSKVAVIKKPIHGLFDCAKQKFKNDPHFVNYVDEIDEVWFFFDVDTNTATEGNEHNWQKYYKIMHWISTRGKHSNIKIRLLMTTGCIEYWLLLHYTMTQPMINTKAQKEDVFKQLLYEEPSYTKSNTKSIKKIANQGYLKAIENGNLVLKNLEKDGMPCKNDQNHNHWLYTSQKTFTTVHEALEFLISLTTK